MAPRRKPAGPEARTPARAHPPAASGPAAYLLDAAQRSALFLDTLLDRGNAYRDHLERDNPPLLKFDHEVVLDGRDLPEPCNYALLRLIAPDGTPTDPAARPVVVVDPRAGHGPGIGGFKFDSEVGVALRAGHPVYFVTFRPQPEEDQTLFTITRAEARFLEEVIARHPACEARPVVIGNCQAGWAMTMLDALRPELFGPLIVVGTPMSYWAGAASLNPMRYSGAMMGGSWLASLTSDLGVDRFDGVHLVDNFERLNPANTFWSRYYKLWSEVDTEAERFLDFERWWGGFFRMTGREIEAIVENLFVGNRLARGTVSDGSRTIDLRAITAPMVVFASWGDNITPPQQALNWIVDAWGDERAIAAAGRTIVYVLHEHVGHLGIFVGADIARKEHDQLVNSLDVLESLPPGLYEMKLEHKAGKEALRWDELEPGDYTVHYEHRTVADIVALNPEGRDDESILATAAKFSELGAGIYKTWMRPWVRAFSSRPFADALGALHPLRLQRSLLTDESPLAPWVRAQARAARTARAPVPDDHPLRGLERTVDALMRGGLDALRDQRDQAVVAWVRAVFGPQGLGAWIRPDAPDADVARERALCDIARAREAALARIDDGGFAEAVCRIVLAGMVSIGAFERRSFRLARLLAHLPEGTAGARDAHIDWTRLLHEQARITAVAPVEALNALQTMLPDTVARERALAVSAAVMMIEPTLANPRSEIIEFLIGALGVDPERVIALARDLTSTLEAPNAPAPRARKGRAKLKLVA